MEKAFATVAGALGLLGAIVYGLERISYRKFYEEFGVTPEDVGVNVSQVLSQTGFGLAMLFLATAAYVMFILLPVLLVYVPLFRVARKRSRERKEETREAEGGGRWRQRRLSEDLLSEIRNLLGNRRWKIGIASTTIALSCLTAVLIYVLVPDNIGRCAAKRNGPAVRSFDMFDMTILGARAEPVAVKWLDDKPPEGFVDNETMVYLGESEGSRVLYRAASEQAVRIPQGDIAMTTDKDFPEFDLTGVSCSQLHDDVDRYRAKKTADTSRGNSD